MPSLRTIGLSVGVALLLGASSQPASAVLVMSYEFDSGLSDNLGNGPGLTSFGGSVSGGRYSFGANQGLRLASPPMLTTDYSIEFKFQMATRGTWAKLIDYENRTQDFGLYTLFDRLRFFNDTASGPTPIPLSTDVVVLLERDGGTGQVTGSVDGTPQWSFTDTSNHGVSSVNTLHFFMDDVTTGGGESFSGSVDYIRIYDRTVVPEPATLSILGLAIVGMAVRRGRSRV